MDKEKLTVASVKNFETEVDYTTVLENFEGPLDLLLYLIKQEEIPAEIIAIAEERLNARRNKDWAKSDELRNLLSEKGYEIKDGKDVYTLTKKQ